MCPVCLWKTYRSVEGGSLWTRKCEEWFSLGKLVCREGLCDKVGPCGKGSMEGASLCE